MDGIKYAVFIEKKILGYWGKINILLMTIGINYDRNKTFGRTLLWGQGITAMNSHQLPRKDRRMGPIIGHIMHYRRMIDRLQSGYSIPHLRKKRT